MLDGSVKWFIGCLVMLILIMLASALIGAVYFGGVFPAIVIGFLVSLVGLVVVVAVFAHNTHIATHIGAQHDSHTTIRQ